MIAAREVLGNETSGDNGHAAGALRERMREGAAAYLQIVLKGLCLQKRSSRLKKQKDMLRMQGASLIIQSKQPPKHREI